MGRRAIDPVLRFSAKYEIDANGCWLWTAACFDNGYAAFRLGERQVRAHRWAYGHFVGPVPEGLSVLHRCDVRRCVNPLHLFVGTAADNQSDMTAKGRGRVGVRNGGHLFPHKLTQAKADEIRRRYSTGGVRQKDLAREFGTDQTMVSRIIRGKAWRHGALKTPNG